MVDSGMTYPWINAILWKRPDKKDIAWAIQLRDAVVVKELTDQAIDLPPNVAHYAVICEAVHEVMLWSPPYIPADVKYGL